MENTKRKSREMTPDLLSKLAIARVAAVAAKARISAEALQATQKKNGSIKAGRD